MTKKANPYTFRLGYNQDWNSFFFSHKKSKQQSFIRLDKSIRDYFKSLGLDITRLKIEYGDDSILVFLFVINVSLVLGTESNKLDEILKNLYAIIKNKKISLKVNIIGIKSIYTDAQAISNLIADQLKKRLKSRMVMRNVINKVSFEREAKGIRVEIKGLIDGNDMAQTRRISWGKTSTSTIDNDIKYGNSVAVTSRGVIGIKVFLNLGKKRTKSFF